MSRSLLMIDTHCHIHGDLFKGDKQAALDAARHAGVSAIINVGTDASDSAEAVTFARRHQLYATVAQHPHEAKHFDRAAQKTIADLAQDPHVVGIGECGLDYYYSHSEAGVQQEALRWHLELAHRLGKPVSFHVRDAFDDFWSILDDYRTVRGVIHSFTSTPEVLEQALIRGLYVAFNGIMTFTHDEQQLEAVRRAPLDRILLETDAPFLTPTPLRGKINEPKHIHLIAEKIANIKGLNVYDVVTHTTRNAQTLFRLTKRDVA